MDCPQIRKLLDDYSEAGLPQAQHEAVRAHLKSCPGCQKELQAIENTWEMIGSLPAIEPRPGYVSRFWLKAAQRKPWPVVAWENLLAWCRTGLRVPSLAAIAALLLIGVLIGKQVGFHRLNEQLAQLPPEDVQMMEHFELAQHFEILDRLDELEDFEAIDNLGSLSS